jgi:acyl-CoA synthetase (AMP-forming)/AMP-acid ligase II
MAFDSSIDLAPIFQCAAEQPHDAAIVDPAGTWSWAEAAAEVARVASGLRGLGLPPDRRIAVLGDNTSTTLLFYTGALLGGFGVIMLNQQLTAHEVGYIVRDGDAAAIWADAGRLSLGRDAVRDLRDVVVLGPEDGTWRRALAEASTEPPSTLLPTTTDLGYTSGTTGRPKGVAVPKEPVATVGDRLTLAARHHSVGLGPHLVAGPLYHGGPHAAVGLLLMATPIVLIGRFDAREALAAIERHGVATSVMVPTHLSRLLQLDDAVRRSSDVSSMRLLVHTGSPCPPALKRAMIDWFGPIIRESYGGIESGPIAAITTDEWLEHPGSAGRAVPPYEIVIFSDDGVECATGEVGLVFARDATGAGITYRNDPEKTAAAHRAPGLFTLGDHGHLDAEGYLYLTSRRDDLVLSGGVNIYPAEAEAALLEHPSVVDVACYGAPDPDLGERLVGVVTVSTPVAVDDLLAFCRERIARQKVPRELRILEEIPRNPMGKIDRRHLRAEHPGG